MKEELCGKCNHSEMRSHNDAQMLWCALHDFPTHKSYNCGEFTPKPQAKKLLKMEYTQPITEDNWKDVLFTVLPNLDTSCLVVDQGSMYFINSNKLSCVTMPRNIMQLLYWLKTLGFTVKPVYEVDTVNAVTNEEDTGGLI